MFKNILFFKIKNKKKKLKIANKNVKKKVDNKINK